MNNGMYIDAICFAKLKNVCAKLVPFSRLNFVRNIIPRGMRHGYGVRTSAAFGIASHSRGGDGARRPSVSSLQPGVEEPKPSSAMSNGSGHGGPGAKDNAELRGGFVLKSRSDEAPVRRRSLVERTGMKNLMQVAASQRKSDIVLQ